MTAGKGGIHVLPSRPQVRRLGADRLEVAAPAKINLNLLVGPRRADGFHAVDSIVAKVTIYDVLELRARRDGRMMFSSRGLDCGPDEANIAFRAARMLEDRASPAGADIALVKNIPPGAGLGGGSSDAAAVLAGLNVLLDLGLGGAELAGLAASLGSDVPLFLGPACCRVTGRGEIVAPAEVHDFVAILILPDEPCATAEVYRAYDALTGEPGRQPDGAAIASQPPSRWRGLLRNDLARAARSVSKRLDEAYRGLAGSLELPVCITGSGGAMFVICDDEAEAAEVWGRIPPDLRERAVIVRPNPW